MLCAVQNIRPDNLAAIINTKGIRQDAPREIKQEVTVASRITNKTVGSKKKPTICPRSLIDRATVLGTPGTVKNVKEPSVLRRKPRTMPASAEDPTTWPGSLSPIALVSLFPGMSKIEYV